MTNESQITRVEKYLRKFATKGRSVSVSKIAAAVNINKENVYRRVYDLKNEANLDIQSFQRLNSKTGRVETAYALAA